MVSLQTPNSPDQRTTTPELEISSKKRKWEEDTVAEENFEKRHRSAGNTQPLFDVIKGRSKAANPKPLFEIDFHMERPLSLDSQTGSDIQTQSGQMHMYNTSTTLKRKCKDTRQSPDWSSPYQMSLDLELNLPCGSPQTHLDDNWMKHDLNSSSHNSIETSKNCCGQERKMNGMNRCPSWVSLEEDQQEMVTAVCMRCHMLVMLFKSSPTCPNCKFLHPPDEGHSNLFGFRLLCCKD